METIIKRVNNVDQKTDQLLRALEKQLGFFRGSLGVWVQQLDFDQKTFALCWDVGGRAFPEPWCENVPLWRLQEIVSQMIRGARFVRRARERGVYLSWSPNALVKWGHKCERETYKFSLEQRLKAFKLRRKK